MSLVSILFLISLVYADTNCKNIAIDFEGKGVCIPKQIDKIIITCYGGASQEIALFMGAKNIVAHPDTTNFSIFSKVFPELKNIPSVGTFNDVNIEGLFNYKPDIVFAGATSTLMNDRIKSSTIPLYTLGIGKHDISSLLDEFVVVGKILDKKDKADELVEFWHDNLALVEEKLSGVKGRKRVLYSSTLSRLSFDTPRSWSEEFVEVSGGVNATKDIKLSGDANVEVLNIINPDVIITTTNNNSFFNVQKILTDPALKYLKAVQSKEVYQAPVGTFWWDRPSPESILGILWLSKLLYPDEFKGVDLKQKTKLFFKKFYNYELSDDEYKSFFNQKGAGV